jgi:hypothetical protein
MMDTDDGMKHLLVSSQPGTDVPAGIDTSTVIGPVGFSITGLLGSSITGLLGSSITGLLGSFITGGTVLGAVVATGD